MIRYLALLLLAGATPVAAQSQAQLNARADAGWKTADVAMTVQWRRAYLRMKARDAQDTSRDGGFGYAAAMLASQRAWLQFRDRQCVVEGGQFAGGSMQPMAQSQCRARLTRERTEQLKELMWTR